VVRSLSTGDQAGLSEVVWHLKRNADPRLKLPDESVVYDFCMELATTHAVKRRHLQEGQGMMGVTLVDVSAC